MFFYLLIISAIFYAKTSEKPRIIAIFKHLTLMNYYLWYIPLNELLLTPAYCLFNDKTEVFIGLFSPDLCIGGKTDVFLMVLGLVFWGILAISCLLNVMFCVDMTYNKKNALAKSGNLLEIYLFFNKNLLLILLIFLKYLQKTLVFLIFLVFLEISEILAFREFMKKPGFFNRKVELFYGFAITVELYVYSYLLLFTILSAFREKIDIGLPLLLTILLPLRLFHNIYQKKTLQNLGFPLEFLYENPDLIDKKLKLFFSYIQLQEFKKAQNPKKKRKFSINYDKKSPYIFMIWGYLFNHVKNCDKSPCFCKKDEKLLDYSLKYEYRPRFEKPLRNFESLVYLKYFVRQQYKESITFVRKSLNLRLNLAYFNFFQLNNFHQALIETFELFEMNSLIKGFNYRSLFLMKRLELEIRDFLETLNKNPENDENYSSFNIEKIVDLESNFAKMEVKIAEFRHLYTNFFLKLSNSSLSLRELEVDCSVLYNLRLEIQRLFSNLSTNPRAIKLYLGYLNNLIFKNDEGYVLERKLKGFLEKIQANEGQFNLFYAENIIYSENSMLFQIGAEQKNLGKILSVNQGACKVLGYQKQELELSNISIILANRLKRFHDNFLDNFMRTGRSSMLYKENSMLARKKNGYFLRVACLVKPSYNFLENSFRFLGFLRPLKRQTEYILTDMFGSIDGMSENLSKLFNVHPKDYEKNCFYIQILCPKLYSFFIERNEKVHNIHAGSRNSSTFTNKTNRTQKFNEIQAIDLMELLDIPKTLSNEAILRFYRYNDGELFGDLRSIIHAIIEKLRKRKFNENNEEPNISGMDKWSLVKRKFIKIAMLGNFFNCKTKINYYKSDDNEFEWLLFSINEIEFTRKLKIQQMANKEANKGFNSNVLNKRFPNILNLQENSETFEKKAAKSVSIIEKPKITEENMDNITNRDKIMTNSNENRYNYTNNANKISNYSFSDNNPQKSPTMQRLPSLKPQLIASTGVNKIVILPEEEDEENDNLIITSEGTPDLEFLVKERISIPVEEARKGLDYKKNGYLNASTSLKKKQWKSQISSNLKENKLYAAGKTFESLNSSDFPSKKLLIPSIMLENNPFLQEKYVNEAMPIVIENIATFEEEDKMAENIINFNGNQLFEDKSEDNTDFSGLSQSKTPKSIFKVRKSVGFGFKTHFEESSDEAPIKNIVKNAEISSKTEKNEVVNREDLKAINKTLKDISRGLTQGIDSNDDDSDKKTVKSTKIGAKTIQTIKSMNKKTNVNVTFTPKTHKLLDILRETIIQKLSLEDGKKDKAYEQSVHSSMNSIFQSQRLLEKSILSEYLPKCYKRLKISLLFLLVLIFVMQISISLIIVELYAGFKLNLTENVNYDKFSNNLLQSLKGIFVYKAIEKHHIFQNISDSERIYYQGYLLRTLKLEFDQIAIFLQRIQLNYDFYHELSPDLFFRKSLYNISFLSSFSFESIRNFSVFPLELLKAVTLYLSELQKFIAKEPENSVFLLDNLFIFTSELSLHDNFSSKRLDLIRNNKLSVLIILILVSSLIIVTFFLRISSHLSCYKYMNEMLELLAKINYEDIEVLKSYYISIASVYDLEHELKGNPTQQLGFNYMENPEAIKGDKTKENNRNRSHKLMNLTEISTPILQIFIANFLFAVFIIGINLIVVLLSHGFDSHFEENGYMQSHLISQFRFRGFCNSYVLAYDKNLALGQYNFSENQILDYIYENLPNETFNENDYRINNDFIDNYLGIITNERICRYIGENAVKRCEEILMGLLKKSLINFELEAFQKLWVMTLEGKISEFENFLEFGEALDYSLILMDFIKEKYVENERNDYDNEINTLIIINCLSIICSFFIICGYYWFSLRKMEKRLIFVRKIFLQIPIAILMRQKRIKKYLQDTSKFYLGG